MLDFRARIPARNYLARREQRRVFAWVMGIGLTLIAAGAVIRIVQQTGAPAHRDSVSVDTRVQPHGKDAGEYDAVTIVKSDDTSARLGDRKSLENFDPKTLAVIRDDTLWVRNDEIDAWMALWTALKRADSDALARQSAGPVGFVELFGQPQAYRGKVIAVRGSARQATYLKAAANSAGVDGYYRLVIACERGPAEPLFLYVLALPHGFPVGDDIRAEVEATGVFFKRMVYPTAHEGELRRAPVVMAKSLDWLHSTTPADESSSALLSILVGVGLAGFVAAVYWASRTRAAIPKPLPERLPPIDEGDLADFNDTLSKLAENDR